MDNIGVKKSWVVTNIGGSSRCKWASFKTAVRNTPKHNKISENQRNDDLDELEDPIMDGKTPVLQPTPNFIA